VPINVIMLMTGLKVHMAHMTSVSQVIRESQVRIDLLLFEALVDNGIFNYHNMPLRARMDGFRMGCQKQIVQGL
jgi:hypothetical protein